MVTVDHATPRWRGHVGVVTMLIPRAVSNPDNTAALVCGPEIMMRFAAAALNDAGLPETAIHLSPPAQEAAREAGLGLVCNNPRRGDDAVGRVVARWLRGRVPQGARVL